MESNVTIDQIDFIFFLLKQNQSYLTINYFIVKCLADNFEIKNEKILVILDFLYDEKLIDKEPESDTEFKYRIRVKGLLFNGYANQIIKDGLNENRIRSNMRWMMIGTLSAVLLALLLLLWQIFLWINPTYVNFPYVLFGIIRK